MENPGVVTLNNVVSPPLPLIQSFVALSFLGGGATFGTCQMFSLYTRLLGSKVEEAGVLMWTFFTSVNLLRGVGVLIGHWYQHLSTDAMPIIAYTACVVLMLDVFLVAFGMQGADTPLFAQKQISDDSNGQYLQNGKSIGIPLSPPTNTTPPIARRPSSSKVSGLA